MTQHRQKRLSIETKGPGLYEFTREAAAFVEEACAQLDRRIGLLTIFVQHTSCSLVVQENADPDVKADLADYFARLVPDTDDPAMAWVRHKAEGPDDMPAHVKAALTSVSLSVPVAENRLALGVWQGLFLFEHRRAPHRRGVVLHFNG